MRRTIIATGVVAGVLGLALATPALAAGGGPGPGGGGSATAVCDDSGTQQGPAARGTSGRRGGMAQGRGGMGQGRGGGAAAGAALTQAQAATLADMAEEEKVAGDLYAVLGEKYGDAELLAIATSEDRHLDRVRMLMTRYGVDDPTSWYGVGEFASAEFQQMYDDLLKQGSADLAAAYRVGVTVEEADIADLDAAIGAATTRDVVRVYTNLRAASQHHLAAFSG